MLERWKQIRSRLEALFEQYGPVALAIHFSLLGLTILGFWLAIRAGFDVQGTFGGAGTLGAAYVASRFTLPVRAAVTIFLTPPAAKLWGRFRARPTDGG